VQAAIIFIPGYQVLISSPLLLACVHNDDDSDSDGTQDTQDNTDDEDGNGISFVFIISWIV